MSEFTVVTHKKKRRGKTNNILEYDELSPVYFNKLKNKTKTAEEAIEESKIWTHITSLIEDCLKLNQLSSISEIVCYGLGSFSNCNNALYQYGLLLKLRDLLKCEVFLYDPIFKEVEKEILRDADFHVIDHNEDGKRKVCTPTLFYLPHCPNELLNNIISANWGHDLTKCVFLSNSISEIGNNKTDRVLKETLPFILKVIPVVTEMAISNTFKFVDVFNDLSIHIFHGDKFLELISEENSAVIEYLLCSLAVS